MTRPRHLAAALATAIAMAASPAVADEESLLETASTLWNGTVDVLVLRPLGTARLALGTFVALPLQSVLDLVVLPVSQEPAYFEESWDRYVSEPAWYVFGRPVGEDLAGR
ncbi:MAG: hypothetical protein NXI30_14685 [bacterium]|nr:hypothetical protein [bacterium]